MERRRHNGAGWEFDKTVQVRDPRTGQVLEENHYALIIDKDGQRYESPIGSGNFFNNDGTLIQKPEAPKAEVVAKDKK